MSLVLAVEMMKNTAANTTCQIKWLSKDIFPRSSIIMKLGFMYVRRGYSIHDKLTHSAVSDSSSVNGCGGGEQVSHHKYPTKSLSVH